MSAISIEVYFPNLYEKCNDCPLARHEASIAGLAEYTPEGVPFSPEKIKVTCKHYGSRPDTRMSINLNGRDPNDTETEVNYGFLVDCPQYFPDSGQDKNSNY